MSIYQIQFHARSSDWPGLKLHTLARRRADTQNGRVAMGHASAQAGTKFGRKVTMEEMLAVIGQLEETLMHKLECMDEKIVRAVEASHR